MRENNSTQMWPIRVSSLSNFLLGGFVTGCLVIGISHLVENRKRTAIEKQFFTEVKELVNWHKQRVELADTNDKLGSYISFITGASKEAAKFGVEFADIDFKEDAPLKQMVQTERFDKAMNLSASYGLPAHKVEALIMNTWLNGPSKKKLDESVEVKGELLSDQKESIKSSASSLKSLAAKVGIKIKCSNCEELLAKRESIARDIRAKTQGLRFVKN